ncbi:hypothetical protein GpartN1_g4573.t1 [Galdieria partita]|uniref:Protein kinase domain-containing protein n=1 Tax=Galdieria partita TaxID=83374 RepID=A0A9C7PZL1_9RHOD|nr:hypothetical protein GpartN1_g4573.t1 [Galdieria partita]
MAGVPRPDRKGSIYGNAARPPKGGTPTAARFTRKPEKKQSLDEPHKPSKSDFTEYTVKNEEEALMSGGSDPIMDPLVLLRRIPSRIQPVHVAYRVRKSALFPASSWREGLVEIRGRWLLIRSLPVAPYQANLGKLRNSSSESLESLEEGSDLQSDLGENKYLDSGFQLKAEFDKSQSTDSLRIRLAMPLIQTEVSLASSTTVKVKIRDSSLEEAREEDTFKTRYMMTRDGFAADGALILHAGRVYIRTSSVEEANTVAEALSFVSKATLPSVQDYEVLAPIGKGASGSVHLAKDIKSGEFVAIKIIDKAAVFESNGAARHTADERLLLQLASDHPFILHLESAFQTKEKLYLVTEFCGGGDLFFFLHHKGSRRIEEGKAKRVAAEIILGLEHIHKLGFVYRDLKPENVFLDKEGHVRLADFGLCRYLKGAPHRRANSFCGTRAYICPEMLRNQPYGYSVDLWTLGVLLYDILCGKSPFYHKNRAEMYRRIQRLPITFPDGLSPEARSLILGLLERDPTERLGCGPEGISEVKQHPFFKDIDWNEILKCAPHENNLFAGISSQGEESVDSDDTKSLLKNFDVNYIANRSVCPVEGQATGKNGEKASLANKKDDSLEERSSARRATGHGFHAFENIFRPLVKGVGAAISSVNKENSPVLLGFEFDKKFDTVSARMIHSSSLQHFSNHHSSFPNLRQLIKSASSITIGS